MAAARDTVAAEQPDQFGLKIDRMKDGTLTWDPDKEVFTGEGADVANQMRERPMRSPYNYDFAG